MISDDDDDKCEDRRDINGEYVTKLIIDGDGDDDGNENVHIYISVYDKSCGGD
jgi:hypothetical protein